MIGGFGDAEVFSFHATKFFNTFEGGIVTTNDDELMDKIRLMRNFGFAGHDEVVSTGTNGKMHEISAAMGLTSLESMDEFIATNRSNYELYRDGLEEVPGVQLIEYDEDERDNYQYPVLEVDEAVTGISRDELVSLLHAENVIVRRYFYPGCHRMEPYRTSHPQAGAKLPVTEALSERVLTLPTGGAVTPEQIVEICELLKVAVWSGSEIHRRLSNQDPALASSE
jgi:dTDP-4-amino-4,6-dideoxygalactose transaminase